MSAKGRGERGNRSANAGLPVRERFALYVDVATEPHPVLGTPCWNWAGPKLPKGYGRFTTCHAGKVTQSYAHRLAWMFEYGEIPAGMWVLHKCDNPSCVRPDHLFLGDSDSNVADMIAKGRNARGLTSGSVKHPDNHAKLSREQVYVIRDSKEPGPVFAARYGVTTACINQARRRFSWAWLPERET